MSDFDEIEKGFRDAFQNTSLEKFLEEERQEKMYREDTNSICRWAEKTFGAPNKTALIEKLFEELCELENAKTPEEITAEASDMCILLSQISGFFGYDLRAGIDRKMYQNRSRTWTMQQNGTFKHDKQQQKEE